MYGTFSFLLAILASICGGVAAATIPRTISSSSSASADRSTPTSRCTACVRQDKKFCSNTNACVDLDEPCGPSCCSASVMSRVRNWMSETQADSDSFTAVTACTGFISALAATNTSGGSPPIMLGFPLLPVSLNATPTKQDGLCAINFMSSLVGQIADEINASTIAWTDSSTTSTTTTTTTTGSTTPMPRVAPTSAPTHSPTPLPTPSPTVHPTPTPTSIPTVAPTLDPTLSPTPAATPVPTSATPAPTSEDPMLTPAPTVDSTVSTTGTLESVGENSSNASEVAATTKNVNDAVSAPTTTGFLAITTPSSASTVTTSTTTFMVSQSTYPEGVPQISGVIELILEGFSYNVETLSEDSGFIAALVNGIAAVASVPSAWVRVTLKPTVANQGNQLRRLQTTRFQVTYTIIIPSKGADSTTAGTGLQGATANNALVDASAIMSSLSTATSTGALAQTLATNIQAAVGIESLTVDILQIQPPTLSTTDSITTSSTVTIPRMVASADKDSDTEWRTAVVIASIVACMLLVLGARCTWMLRARKEYQSSTSPVGAKLQIPTSCPPKPCEAWLERTSTMQDAAGQSPIRRLTQPSQSSLGAPAKTSAWGTRQPESDLEVFSIKSQVSSVGENR